MLPWSKKDNKNKAVGLFRSSSGTALAVIEGVRDSCPRVSHCALLPLELQVEDYVNSNLLRNSACVDVLSPDHYNLIQVDLQGVKDEEKREAARWQIRELIDYPAEEAVIDLLEVPIVGEKDMFRTFAVTAPISALKARTVEMIAAELHLEAIDIPEFAIRNLLELYHEESRGLCLLWIREQSGLVVICRGETLYFSRSINVGMTHFQQEPVSTDDGLLSENNQFLLDGIILEVQRSLDYCESNFRLPPVPKILVAFCGNETAEFLEYLDRSLQSDVCAADFRQILDLPSDIDPPTINACLPALGAALRAGGRI